MVVLRDEILMLCLKDHLDSEGYELMCKKMANLVSSPLLITCYLNIKKEVVANIFALSKGHLHLH